MPLPLSTEILETPWFVVPVLELSGSVRVCHSKRKSRAYAEPAAAASVDILMVLVKEESEGWGV